MRFSLITTQRARGFTLIEMLIYIVLLAMITIGIIWTILGFVRPYQELVVIRTIDQSAYESLGRMTREIRDSGTIDTVNSSFGTNLGTLSLIKSSGGVSTTTKFYVQNGVLKIDVNGSTVGPLTDDTASVTTLMFTMASSSNSTAVKIDMTIQSSRGAAVRTKNYHTTVILKGT